MIEHFTNTTKTAGYYLGEADKARNEKDYYNARRFLRDGVKAHPESARLWQELAKALRSNHTWDDETLRCFATALRLAPDSRHIAMEYAAFLDRKNQYGKAEEIYMSLLAGEGENPRLFCALGNHFQLQKKLPLALACFKRAHDIAPQDNISERRYIEVAGILGRDCDDKDLEKLRFRIVQMTGQAKTHAQPPKPAPSASTPGAEQPAYNGPVWS